MYKALDPLPEAWAPQGEKFRTPQDFIIAGHIRGGTWRSVPTLAVGRPAMRTRSTDFSTARAGRFSTVSLSDWIGPDALEARAGLPGDWERVRATIGCAGARQAVCSGRIWTPPTRQAIARATHRGGNGTCSPPAFQWRICDEGGPARFLGHVGAGAHIDAVGPASAPPQQGRKPALLCCLLRGSGAMGCTAPPVCPPSAIRITPGLRGPLEWHWHPTQRRQAEDRRHLWRIGGSRSQHSCSGRGEFMPLVAVAPPYWGRSHFDAQDCVEMAPPRVYGAPGRTAETALAAALRGSRTAAIAKVMPLMIAWPANYPRTWSPPCTCKSNRSCPQRLEPLTVM